MEWGTRRSLDRVGLLAIVLGGHWLLIDVLCGERLVEPRKVTVDSPESWIWIPVPDIPRELPERIKKIDRHPRTQIAQPVRTEPPIGGAAAGAQPSEPAVVNAPDWLSRGAISRRVHGTTADQRTTG